MLRPVRRLLALLLISTSGLAAEERWLRLATPHFEIFTPGSEGAARRTLSRFEQIRAFFLELLKLESRSSQPIRIIAFSDPKQYEPFRPNQTSTAYYLAAHDRDYIVLADVGKTSQSTAVHEYVHLLVRHSRSQFPPWLNEGLAELYASLDIRSDEVRVGEVNKSRLTDLRRTRWLPVERIVRITPESPEYGGRAHAGAFYSQSWALTHMLALGDGFAPKMPQLLEALGAGDDSVETFERLYGRTPAQIDEALRAYVRGGGFYVQRIPFRSEKFRVESAAEAASGREVELSLAQLLASIPGSGEQARRRFRALGERYPDDARVPEALGYLLWRSQDHDGAVDAMKRAVALGSRNDNLYYDLAAVSLGSEPREFQIDMLERAVEIRPANHEARRMLANLLMEAKEWARALTHFNRIGEVENSREAYNVEYGRAFAHTELGELDAAQRGIAKARTVASSSAEIRALDDLARVVRLRRNASR